MQAHDYLFLNGLETYLQKINHPQVDTIDKIRRAIVNGNPYAMRDLIVSEVYRGVIDQTEEFAKAIVSYYLKEEDDYNARRVMSFLSYCVDDEYIKNAAKWCISWHQLVNLDEHFSRGQVMSKLWLIEKLNRVLEKREQEGYPIKNIVQYGGWYSTVAWLILQNENIEQYISIDSDPMCVGVADAFNEAHYNNSWRFKAITMDVNDINLEDGTFEVNTQNRQRENVVMRIGPQLIINTSCEHMTDDWFYNLPPDTMVCLQTNDYFSREEHINCVESIDEALEKYKFTRVYYSGELETPLYKRFMIIGRT